MFVKIPFLFVKLARLMIIGLVWLLWISPVFYLNACLSTNLGKATNVVSSSPAPIITSTGLTLTLAPDIPTATVQSTSRPPITSTISPQPTNLIKTQESSPFLTLDNLSQVTQIGPVIPLEWRWGQLIFRPDAVWIAEPISDNEVNIKDIVTQKTIANFVDESAQIELLVVSNDNRLLAAVSPSSGKITLWELQNFTIQTNFVFEGYNTSPYLGVRSTGVFSPDDRYLAIASCRVLGQAGQFSTCQSSGVVVYEITTGTIVSEWAGLQKQSWGVAFDSSSKLLAIAGEGEAILDADLILWDIEENERSQVMQMSGLFQSIAFNSWQNNFVVSGETSTGEAFLSLVDLETWRVTSQLSGFSPEVISISKQSPIIVTGGFSVTHGYGIDFWNAEGGRHLFRINTDGGNIYNLSLNPDGKKLYTMNELQGLQVWGIR